MHSQRVHLLCSQYRPYKVRYQPAQGYRLLRALPCPWVRILGQQRWREFPHPALIAAPSPTKSGSLPMITFFPFSDFTQVRSFILARNSSREIKAFCTVTTRLSSCLPVHIIIAGNFRKQAPRTSRDEVGGAYLILYSAWPLQCSIYIGCIAVTLLTNCPCISNSFCAFVLVKFSGR